MPVITKHGKKKSGDSSIIDRIGPIGFDANDGLKLCVYGKSGTGKTTFWSSWPKPILCIVCSGGNKAGELRSIDTAEYRKSIKQVKVTTREEIKELAEYADSSGEFTTVVVDHVTGLQDRFLANILGLDDLPPQSSWGMAQQRDWGQCGLHTKEALRYLLELECNVVLVGQERAFNTEAENAGDLLMPFVGPALSPSTAGWLLSSCDYVVQTFLRQKTKTKTVKMAGKEVEQTVKVKGVDYCLRTGQDPINMTKFRMPKGRVLPDVIVDPTYDKIKELIKG